MFASVLASRLNCRNGDVHWSDIPARHGIETVHRVAVDGPDRTLAPVPRSPCCVERIHPHTTPGLKEVRFPPTSVDGANTILYESLQRPARSILHFPRRIALLTD